RGRRTDRRSELRSRGPAASGRGSQAMRTCPRSHARSYESHRRGCALAPWPRQDRKSTRLNSSHVSISYAVFCLKKKKNHNSILSTTNDIFSIKNQNWQFVSIDYQYFGDHRAVFF